MIDKAGRKEAAEGLWIERMWLNQCLKALILFILLILTFYYTVLHGAVMPKCALAHGALK